jgi:hypothetical protein
MFLRHALPLLAAALLSTVLSGCSKEVTCGPGTSKSGSQCALVGGLVCAEGTVFVADRCLPFDDTLRADMEEVAEPNDTAATPAGTIPVPALGQAVVVHGCVDPAGKGASGGNGVDLDAWLLTATGPTALEITVDGVGGLTSGFVVEEADAALSTSLGGWRRIGLGFVSDTAHRQLYLPAAGSYSLVISDARSLVLNASAGSPVACYFATVRQVALPTATAGVEGANDGTSDGDLQVVTISAQADADLLTVDLSGAGNSLTPAFVALRTDGFKAVNQNLPDHAFAASGGLALAETVTVVVDPELVEGVGPQPFGLQLLRTPAQQLPVGGGSVTVTKKAAAVVTYRDVDYHYFDVTGAGTVVHFDLVANTPVDMLIARRDVLGPTTGWDAVAVINAIGGAGVATFQGQFVRFLAPGRYYLVTFAPAGAVGSTYTVTSTLTPMSVGAVSWATPLTAQPLPIQGSAFHSISPVDPNWVEFGLAGASWGAGNVRVTAYDLAGEGWLGSNYLPVFAGSALPAGGTFGRIMIGDSRDYLLRVDSTAVATAGATYDLTVSDRSFVDLGTIAAGSPISSPADALAASGVVRYLVRGSAGNTLTALMTPADGTVDLRVTRIDANEVITATVDAGGAGVGETLSANFPIAPNEWIAFQVTNKSTTTATTVASALSAVAPRMYVVATGTLPYVNACAGGTTLMTGQDDLIVGALTLPASFSGFQLLGGTVGATAFRVSSNGWLSWDTGTPSFAGFSNQQLPNAATPNGVIAPYWDDLDTVTVCRLDAPGTVTLQWTGNLYTTATAVAFQVVLHDTGVIDFIYGSGQVANGSSATIGVENLPGLVGQQLSYNTVRALAGTSWTLTPE